VGARCGRNSGRPPLLSGGGMGPRRKGPRIVPDGRIVFRGRTARLFGIPRQPALRAAAILPRFDSFCGIRDTTWPQSVARHPEYVKAPRAVRPGVGGVCGRPRRPSRFLAVAGDRAARLQSRCSHWGRTSTRGRAQAGPWAANGPPSLLCVGILEPRKNQTPGFSKCATLFGARGSPSSCISSGA